jgi:flagellar FliL protein
MAKETPSSGAPAPAGAAAAGAAASAAAGPDSVPAGKSGGLKPWIPALAAIVFAPALSWALVQFVLVPHFRKQLAEPVPAQVAAHAGGKDGKAGKEGTEGAPSYEFQNIVVNLAGTMGTRYLKTSFLVTGADADIKAVFEENKPRLTDVTLNVLSSLSLADLEEPGSKNVLREKLVTAYNRTLGRKVADQVYFSDFVVQ